MALKVKSELGVLVETLNYPSPSIIPNDPFSKAKTKVILGLFSQQLSRWVQPFEDCCYTMKPVRYQKSCAYEFWISRD